VTLHGIADFFHGLGHRHCRLGKDGVGEFSFCEQRWPRGGVRVTFRPDFSASRWHGVPAVADEHGVLLMNRMLDAENAHHAMSMLRAGYGQPEDA
jgi:hypothetical protein